MPRDAGGTPAAQRVHFLESAVFPRSGLNEYVVRSSREVLEQRGAEPSLDLLFRPRVPHTIVLFPTLDEMRLISGERAGREDQGEAMFRVGNVGREKVHDVISSADKRLLVQPHLRVIEHPRAGVLVGGDDQEGIHGEGTLWQIRFADQSSR